MLRDFSKIFTFLTVVKEGSFSVASKKLNISQPAVTQQIKSIEESLNHRLIERKKSGVVLTKEGEYFLQIAQRLEEAIKEGEKELAKMIVDEIPINIAACSVAGEYLIPSSLNKIASDLQCDFVLMVEKNNDITSLILNRQSDLALFSPSFFDERIEYVEWVDDEIVIFSNWQIKDEIDSKDLESYNWIGREKSSQTRKTMQNALKNRGVDCERFFDMKNIFNNANAVKRAVLNAPKEPQTLSIISRYVIADEIASGKLFSARIKDCAIKRKLYIAYLKSRKDEVRIQKAVSFFRNGSI